MKIKLFIGKIGVLAEFTYNEKAKAKIKNLTASVCYRCDDSKLVLFCYEHEAAMTHFVFQKIIN